MFSATTFNNTGELTGNGTLTAGTIGTLGRRVRHRRRKPGRDPLPRADLKVNGGSATISSFTGGNIAITAAGLVTLAAPVTDLNCQLSGKQLSFRAGHRGHGGSKHRS